MKVAELLLELHQYKPSRSKRGYVQGTIQDWMKMFQASEEDVQAGLKMVFDDKDLMHRLEDAGLRIEDRPRAAKLGTIKIIVNKPYVGHDKRTYSDKRLISIQAHGRITIENAQGRFATSRWPVANVPKPRVVVGKPVETIYKTLKQCLELVIDRTAKWSREYSAELAKAEAKPVKEEVTPNSQGWYIKRTKTDKTTELVKGPMSEDAADKEVERMGGSAKGVSKEFITTLAIKKRKDAEKAAKAAV